jgi:branched-subunit amino acid transport protein
MVKYRTHIAFVFIMSIYFLTRYLRVNFSDLPDFFRYHFTDLLFVPAMSLFALIIIRFMKRDATITIHWWAVALQVLIITLYFEWYLPNNPPEGHIHISDWVDSLMYVVGGILFILAQPFLTPNQEK